MLKKKGSFKRSGSYFADGTINTKSKKEGYQKIRDVITKVQQCLIYCLSLCKCIPYSSQHSSEDDDKQPFALKVSLSTLIVSAFHSHLLSCEIIGFLAGRWNSDKKCIFAVYL